MSSTQDPDEQKSYDAIYMDHNWRIETGLPFPLELREVKLFETPDPKKYGFVAFEAVILHNHYPVGKVYNDGKTDSHGISNDNVYTILHPEEYPYIKDNDAEDSGAMRGGSPFARIDERGLDQRLCMLAAGKNKWTKSYYAPKTFEEKCKELGLAHIEVKFSHPKMEEYALHVLAHTLDAQSLDVYADTLDEALHDIKQQLEINALRAHKKEQGRS